MRYFIVLALLCAGCSGVSPYPAGGYQGGPVYQAQPFSLPYTGVDPALFMNQHRTEVTTCDPQPWGGFTCTAY
jgi:hypothetical protein